MANSKITFAFNQNSKLYKTLSFRVRDENGNDLGINFVETFLPFERTSIGQMPLLGNSAVDTNDYVHAQIYSYYFGLDYNQNNLFSIALSNVSVEITINQSGYTFYDAGAADIAVVTIENEDISTIVDNRLNLSSAVYSSVSGEECAKVQLEINTEQNFENLFINNTDQNIPSPTNQHVIQLLRGESYFFVFNKPGSNGNVVLRYPADGFVNIPVLSSDLFELLVSTLSGTGVLNVRINVASVLTYQYSIDAGSNWQASPTFTGLAEGAYTLRIRDYIDGVLTGCEINIPFNVGSGIIKSPFVFISKANGILFKKSENEEFINDTNSFNPLTRDIWYCNEAILNTTDPTKIQLKTTYDNIDIKLRDEENNEYNIVPVKRSNNLSVFRSLDALIQIYNETQAVVYFNFGNEYDSDQNIIGSHSLQGSLPDFAIEKREVFLDGLGIFEIKEIIYLDSIGRNCIVIDYAEASGLPTSIRVDCLYNIIEYEIYEFDVDWSAYPEGYYDIKIEFTDPAFAEDLTYISENINLKENHENTVAITYYNNNNKDVFYYYGIQHFVRANLLSMQKVIRDEIDINITDQSVDTVESTLNEGELFIFDGLTRENLTKLAIALSCEFIYIEGLKYTKAEPLEPEPIEGTNLQNLTANMLLDTANQNDVSGIEVSDGSESLEGVPGLITLDGDLIKYQ